MPSKHKKAFPAFEHPSPFVEFSRVAVFADWEAPGDSNPNR